MSKKIGKILLIGSVDEAMHKDFTEKLQELANRGIKKVNIILNSAGGSVTDALAIVSTMRTHRMFGFKFTIIAQGAIMSAATLILAAGDKRIITEESWVMVHESSVKLKGNVSVLEKELSQLRRMEVQWCDLMAKYTMTSAKEWARMNKETTYLDADECLRLGLADSKV